MKVTYQIVTKARTPVIQVEDLDRSVEDEEEFQRVAVNVMRGVDAGAFPPVRGWQCRSCSYSHACRAAGGAGKNPRQNEHPDAPSGTTWATSRGIDSQNSPLSANDSLRSRWDSLR